MIFWELFYTYFKIGLFTFGGGYAMLPLVQSEVLAHGWLTETDIINFVAISESTPGPFAINLATFVGVKTAGFWGAVCATLGCVLPSFIVIMIISRCYTAFQKSSTVKGLMAGLKPAAVGLIGYAVLNVAKTVFFPCVLLSFSGQFAKLIVAVLIFGLMVFLSKKKVHPILIIFLSALIGLFSGIFLKLSV